MHYSNTRTWQNGRHECSVSLWFPNGTLPMLPQQQTSTIYRMFEFFWNLTRNSRCCIIDYKWDCYSTESQIQSWKRTEVHGVNPNLLDQETVDKDVRNREINGGDLYRKRAWILLVIWEWMNPSNIHRKSVINDLLEICRYRRCGKSGATIYHVSVCHTALGTTDIFQTQKCSQGSAWRRKRFASDVRYHRLNYNKRIS